ncbi:hypothetical protein SEPCBS119000_003845 [Sporothrix epigloea]|uniref:Uncharacterized protein n=1 Tax=Sporothrix epigloea TaxID=1892477 RepID=A0ABP0DR00_9PEZI
MAADTLLEADSKLQVPVTRPSSQMGNSVTNDSRRSSASRDQATRGSSSAGSPSNSASTVSSDEPTTSTFLPPAAQSSLPVPYHTLPPGLPRRHGANTSQISTSPASSASQQDYRLSLTPSPSGSHRPARAAESRTRRISHRPHRSSGAFLLTDQLGSGRHGNASSHKPPQLQSGANRGSSNGAAHETPKRVLFPSSEEVNTPDKTHPGAIMQARGAAIPTASSSPTTASPASSANRPLDLDSAQIVNMALSLSESRRLAYRRNVSQQLPPRFAPASDNAGSGARFRQQQQQRRPSHTMSPRPERPLSGFFSSGQAPQSQGIPRADATYTLQPAFEVLPYDSGGGQNAYRYRFSQSTIARAQKAKDYLELLAQQRRLLELIPPLTPGPLSRSRATSLGSPPSTSVNSGQPQQLLSAGSNPSSELVPGSVRLGRPYNPLQYIRNRKVRVRERRTIDGQAQGFGDVSKTAEWVDEVARRAATGQDRMLGGYTLPEFSGANADAALQSSPPASRVTGQGISAKPKRPRIDWTIDPADMIADVYWLEQGDNKKLVEDHHWRRVFPQDSALYRPVSQRTDESLFLNPPGKNQEATGPFPTLTEDGHAGGSNAKTPLLPSVGAQSKELGFSPEQDQSSATKRARQKLNELRAFRHRHTPSNHAHGSAWFQRGSFSDTSDSDNDRSRASQAHAASLRATRAEKSTTLKSEEPLEKAPEKDENAAATAAAAALKEKTRPGPPSAAVTGASPASGKALTPQPATDPSLQRGRASLELPAAGPRLSLEYDSSRPTSPEMRPVSNDGPGFVPPLGGDLSPPSSRAASPPRYRFQKVKSMFRDHSRERERERDRDRSSHPISQGAAVVTDSSRTHPKGSQQWQQQQQQPQRDHLGSDATPLATHANTSQTTLGQTEKTSRGPGPETSDSHRLYASINNVAGNPHNYHRSEEGGPTLRGLFKGGPRIDAMLRDGLSKVSDILWRREGSEVPEDDSTAAAPSSSSSSDDDSESEATEPRGRLGKKLPPWSRSPSAVAGDSGPRKSSEAGQKHYLDVMPMFGRSGDAINRPPSRQSARFERLKPPPIDVHYAPTSTTDAANDRKQSHSRPRSRRSSSLQREANGSESEVRSRRSSQVSGVASSVNGSIDDRSLKPVSRPIRPPSASAGRNTSHTRWSMSQPTFVNRGSLSRREVARLHAFVYSSAILAKELLRHANEPKPLAPQWNDGRSNGAVTSAGDEDGQDEAVDATQNGDAGSGPIIVRGANGETSLTWADIAAYAPNPAEIACRPVKQVELYPLAAQVLGSAIQRSGASWQNSAETFANAKMPELRQRIEKVHTRVAIDLSGLARQAADEADEVTQDLMAVQRLRVKRVGDSIEKMLRRRQRRFRWVRRAGWLTVEWLLLGLMWYVWFVVTLARIVLGFGRGVYASVRWLLWL